MNISNLIDSRILLKISGGQFMPDDEYLLVEGSTDKELVDRLNIKKLQCISTGTIIDSEWAFKGNREKPNSKKAILDTIKETEKYYGLVDKDFDTPREIQKYHKNIMVTPKHDLETLLLSTDENIFEAPANIKESFGVALYIAYLIGNVRIRLLENKCRYRKLEDNDYENIFATKKRNLKLDDFADLTELVDFKKLVELSIDEKDKLLKIQEKKIIDDIKQLEIEHVTDLYDIANGHDIANVMKLLCEDDIDDFIKKHNAEHHRDRAIEFAIIDKYELAKFKTCSLYEDMEKKGLIPTAI